MVDASARICAQVLSLDAYARSRCLLVFLSTEREVRTERIVEAALESGRMTTAPRIESGRGRMTARRITDLGSSVRTGRFGIREPAGDEIVAADGIDLVLVPGLAFDRNGRRLGKGGGYYDRFLARCGARTTRCALGFGCQVLPAVPAGARDERVDLLVTEEDVWRFARRDL